MIGHSRGTETQVTYNALGKKIVVATADTDRNAAVAAGQECGEDGYSSIGSGQEEDRHIFTVECTSKEESSLADFLKSFK